MLHENASNYAIVTAEHGTESVRSDAPSSAEILRPPRARGPTPHAGTGVDGPRNKAQRGEEQEGPAHSPHAPRTLHATGRGAVRIPKTVPLTISRTSP
jgi:hypothetical protein